MISARLLRILAPLWLLALTAPVSAQTTLDFSDFDPNNTQAGRVVYGDLLFTQTEWGYCNGGSTWSQPTDMVVGCVNAFGTGYYLWWSVPAASSYFDSREPFNLFTLDLAAVWNYVPAPSQEPSLTIAGYRTNAQNGWDIAYQEVFSVGDWATYQFDWLNIDGVVIGAGDSNDPYPMHRITYGVDNIVYSVTPEPEEVLLVSLGLLGVALVYWRSRRRLAQRRDRAP